MREIIVNIVLLSVLWLVYFTLHSGLASLTVKQWLATHRKNFMPFYRLFFNLQSLVLLALPLWFMWRHRTDYLWQWEGWLRWLGDGAACAAIIGFLFTLRYYNTGEFLGIRQARNHIYVVHDQESLHITPFHRFVRHPWYALALVIIWTRSMDSMFLVSAILWTMYFKIGSLMEEKKLIAYHGHVYDEYRSHVPGLIPLPWRYLSKAQAREFSRAAGYR
jgi:protein-S-isoprenylcysteine O-methyltransferase Ste14